MGHGRRRASRGLPRARPAALPRSRRASCHSPHMPFAISARLMQTPAADHLQVIEDAVVAVDDAGLVTAVEAASSEAGAALLRSTATRVATPPGSMLIPGMVDLHVHDPQSPQLGTGLDLPLERWLFEHTFPLEARYADPSFARPVWADMVSTLLRH